MIKILYLEDEPELVETLPVVLQSRKADLEIQGFGEVKKALDALQTQAYDGVMLDISMPPDEDMDLEIVEYGRLTGIEVARRIKDKYPHLPIVALTVVSDPGMKTLMFEAGISVIINKPAEIDSVLQAILRVVKPGKGD
jgi:CheY-like chemotaxis protein